MLRITNRTNRPVFLGSVAIGIYDTVTISDYEGQILSSTIKKLENSGIISSVSIEEKKSVNQEATSLASETTTKRGRKKSKKGEKS